MCVCVCVAFGHMHLCVRLRVYCAYVHVHVCITIMFFNTKAPQSIKPFVHCILDWAVYMQRLVFTTFLLVVGEL